MLGFPDPAYPDSSYYVEVARSLAAGHGLSVDFVWIFAEVGGRIPANPVLPIPSNAHWLPLASFVQVPFIATMGATAIASALPMVIIGSLMAPLTWAIARDAGASTTVQKGAGVLAAIPAAGVVFMAQPENFALVGVLWPAALWLAARGLRGDRRSYVAAGLLVGLASITRNDAFLLGAAVGLVFVFDRVRAWRRGARPALPLTAYEAGTARETVPTLACLTEPLASITARARRLRRGLGAAVVEQLAARIVEGRSQVGGGALPTVELPTAALALGATDAAARALDAVVRAGDPPVIGRLVDDRLFLDCRTVLPGQVTELVRVLTRAARA
jgi:hypothetical protein